METKHTHTPGPWTHDDAEIYGADDSLIARMAWECDPGDVMSEQHKRDARLIAAAPELLAEAEKQLAWLRHVRPQVSAPESVLMGFDQSIKYLESAIAKATGSDK